MLFENINYLLWEWVSGEPRILSCSSVSEEHSGWLLSGPVRDHSCQRLLRGEEGWRPRTSRVHAHVPAGARRLCICTLQAG